MSDTLLEPEDQMADNKASARGFDQCQHDYGDGIRCCVYRNCHENQYMDHRFTEADYCDECKGRPHAPWCPNYKPVEQKRSPNDECAFVHRLVSGNMRCGALREHHSQYTGHEFTEPQQSASEHEPAARGGGERVILDSDLVVRPLPNTTKFLLVIEDNDWPIAEFYRAEEAEGLAYEHNQHQALVAERERLRAAIEVAIHNLNAGNDPKFLADYLRLTLDQKGPSE